MQMWTGCLGVLSDSECFFLVGGCLVLLHVTGWDGGHACVIVVGTVTGAGCFLVVVA